jgi:hypothetical protein
MLLLKDLITMKHIITLTIIIFFTACGSDSYTPPKASVNFNTQNYIWENDENNETVIKDIRQNLTFVNSKQACYALHNSSLTEVENFCQNIISHGYDDWRAPTLTEIQNLSKGMDSENLVPYFTFPECKRIVGIKDDGTLGCINTHNLSPKFKEVPLEFPAGVRCVR